MIRVLVTMVLALSVATLATARDLEMLEGAYELLLADIELPGSTAGTTVMQPCEECDPVALRVNAATRYRLNGQELPLAEFSEAVDALRDTAAAEDAAVAVFYDLTTTRVTRIAVVYGAN